MEQSAVDSNCKVDDFKCSENTVVVSKANENARKYLDLPFLCDFTSYGDNIVASVSEDLVDIVTAYIHQYPVEHCFETPNLHVLMDQLNPLGMNVCFMATYFLPDVNQIQPIPCAYETKQLEPKDFQNLYLPQWGNALCEQRKHLDVLAVGAYDKGKLIGLAGCSADGASMWQIGIDVLPQYRKQGIGNALTNQLALVCLSREIVPFYCCAWANIKSFRNAIKSGFQFAWVQMTVKPKGFIQRINEK